MRKIRKRRQENPPLLFCDFEGEIGMRGLMSLIARKTPAELSEIVH
jgi:hypothetical protein